MRSREFIIESTASIQSVADQIKDEIRTKKTKPAWHGKWDGYCALVTCELWRRIGMPSDTIPVLANYRGEEHCFLYNANKDIGFDPTASQYGFEDGEVRNISNKGFAQIRPMSEKMIKSQWPILQAMIGS